MAIECDYKKGCYYYDGKQYLEAISIFENILDYSDAKSKIPTAYSLYYFDQGVKLYEEAMFYQAIEELEKSDEPQAKDLIKESKDAIAFINNICGYYGLVGKVSNGREHYIPAQNNNECYVISFNFDRGSFLFEPLGGYDHSYSFNFDINYPYYFYKHTDGSYLMLEGTMLIENDVSEYHGVTYYEYRKER
jgi:tetratricopeptide (TPR) repeat protein